MSNQTQRDQIYQNALANFLRKEYPFQAVRLTPAKRGFYGETWRLESDGKCYFVKLVYFSEYQFVYRRSFEVIDFLGRQGIDFISTIVKTAAGRLFTGFDGAILGVFDWIDGENIETDATKIQEYGMLSRIYSIPPDGCEIPREDFSGKSAERFFRQWNQTRDHAILAQLENHREKLESRSARLRHFADLCRPDTSDFYITHGDAGGNFFVSGDRNFLVDWDDVRLAPPERDAWVMGYREWARCLFQQALRQNGIEYTLRPERLAYYCYEMFFFWLTWLVRCSNADDLANFFQGYRDDRIEYADQLPMERFRSGTCFFASRGLH